MATYVVTYELFKPELNQEHIAQRLKVFETHSHLQRSLWVIVTDLTAAQIHEHMAPALKARDKVFVAKLAREAAWQSYGPKITQWLRGYLR